VERLRSTTHRFETSLFYSRNERVAFLAILLLLFSISIGYKYYNYSEFKSKDAVFERGEVLLQYTKFSKKADREYEVLKIASDSGYEFYTVSWDEIRDLEGRSVAYGILSKDISFLEFVDGFFAPLIFLKLELEEPKSFSIKKFISAQHESLEANQIYQRLFFASSIDKELRDSIIKWGVAHLFALSGFHLGLLGGMLFFILYYPYTLAQRRFFRDRNRNFDMFLIISFILFAYMIYVGTPASLLRSFAMFLVGGLLYFRHVQILSFEFLGWVVLLLLALFPELFFDIGFWLSVGGVYYIYLFIRYFLHINKIAFVLLLNLYLFVSMLPLAHLFFGIYSPYALFSPFISIVFVVFYPAVMLLHLFGLGGVLDSYLLEFFALPKSVVDIKLAWYIFVVYGAVSLLSMYKRAALWLQIALSALFLLYLNLEFIGFF
jgi:competence protein ComEC